MTDKTMSISNQVKYLKTLNGITWILAGISDIFSGAIPSTLTSIFLIISLVLQLKVSLSKKESDDEMSIDNKIKAGAMTQSIMHIIFCTAAVVLFALTSFPNLHLDWKNLIVPVFFIFIGIEYIIWGLSFKKLEEE